jgi:hypothetical protein
MQNFTTVEVSSLSTKIGGRCDRRAELDDPEFHESLTIDRVVELGSFFGDGEFIQFDLCQHCVRDFLGSWVRIKRV